MRRVRWALGGTLLVAALSLVPAAPATAGVPVLVLDGTGYGHGVGLSQWGAEYLARTGRSTNEILGTFYPGVGLGEATGSVRVAVHAAPKGTTTLSFPQGGEVRSAPQGPQAPGFPVRVGPGGKVRITYDGAYRVTPLVRGQSTRAATPYRQEPCSVAVICTPTTIAPPVTTTTTTTPPTTTTRPDGGAPAPSSPSTATASSPSPVTAVPARGGVTTVDDRGRAYRGAVEASGGSGLRLVNLVGVEDYLRGMAEVPSTWPAAAVQAQTVAARTYALRSMRTSGEICDDARCQVYVGATAESPGQDAAVAATARQVLTYDGQLAAAVYSADAGGVSANTFEGFGTPDGVYPYLRNVAYETDNPLPWHVVVGLDELGRRFGYAGTVTGARVGDAGPSGRALKVVLEGTAGDQVVDGRSFARALGLRSTRFTAKLGTSDGTPVPPPPAEEAIQLLPEETADAALAPVSSTAGARQEPSATADAARAGLPDAADPLRHPASLVAILLLAVVAGGHLPLALARSRRPVRTSAWWSSLIRSR